jgi:hypothetical protein
MLANYPLLGDWGPRNPSIDIQAFVDHGSMPSVNATLPSPSRQMSVSRTGPAPNLPTQPRAP